MIRTPPHKQTNPAKAAGQIKTLGEYIKQKTAHEPKKLEFGEWYRTIWVPPQNKDLTHYLDCKAAWEASRANI